MSERASASPVDPRLLAEARSELGLVTMEWQYVAWVESAGRNLTAWLPHNPPADPHRNKKTRARRASLCCRRNLISGADRDLLVGHGSLQLACHLLHRIRRKRLRD